MNRFALTNLIIFTVDAHNRIFTNGTLLVEDDRIKAVGPAQAIDLPPDIPVQDCGGRSVLLPGLVDSHSHSSLLRGVTENMPLLEWLPQYQLEHRALTEDDAFHAARLCYLEALKNGTTCVLDMYRFMDRCADAASELGIRVNLAPYAADVAGYDFFATPAENQSLIRTHHNSQQGRIQVWMGLEHLFYCTPTAYHHALHCAKEYGVRIHTHACEQFEEEIAVKQLFGQRSIGMLQQYGILGEHTTIAHCVWLNDEEIALLADTGTRIAHCPVSNAKLASGVARVPDIRAAGITVGLGTDGNVCNNSLDLFEEMKFASLLQKATRLDATVLPAREILRMATIDGAKALGLEHMIGSIEVGKKADFILLDTTAPNLTPVVLNDDGGNLLWNLVFSARGSNVTDVWVDGRQLVQSGQLTVACETTIVNAAQHCAQSLLERCDAIADQVVHIIR